MVDVFEYSDYRNYLQDLVNERKQKGFAQSEVADAVNCQPAYLSHVLKGKAELTEDHGIGLCNFLKFSQIESEYFMVILRLGRAGTPQLRKYLEESRQRLIKASKKVLSKLEKNLTADGGERFVYLNSSWVPGIIRAVVACPKYNTAAAIAHRIKLEKEIVEFHLEMLEKYKFIKFENGKYIDLEDYIHFPEDSLHVETFQTNKYLHALDALSRRSPEDLRINILMTLDQKTVEEIRRILKKAIDKVMQAGGPSPEEDLYAVSIDFFKA
jgi:uncharacterized protein (TIGR02147 family)